MARKDVVAIVSGAGWIAGFADKLIRELRQRNVTDEQIHSLVTDDGEIPMDKIADAFAEVLCSRNIFRVTVDYTQSLAEMIAAGKYDWINPDITADNFPISGNDQVEVNLELIHFNRTMESDDVLKELDKAGLRPATIAELLAFGIKYPEKQREFPVVALGSIWQGRGGDRDVPGLWSLSDVRSLSLSWFESRWDEDCRFAAARK